MAVYSDYLKEPAYIGFTLGNYEHNGYDDSDYYAVVWDDETDSVKTFEYMTTRFPCSGSVVVDADRETKRKVYRYFAKMARSDFDKHINPENAKKLRKGDTVTVVRGVKVPKGTVGEVFWIGTKYNYYSHCDEKRVGIKVGEEKMFLPYEYCVVNNWEDRLVHGWERKEEIRRLTYTLMHNRFIYCVTEGAMK